MSTVRYGPAARRELLAGVDLVARAVGCTFGPGGRAVAMTVGERVTLIRDGATVGRAIFPDNAFARQGSELVKAAADRVAERFGDGSSTAAVLTGALLRRSLRLVEAGHDPLWLARGLADAATLAAESLRAAARPAGRHELEATARAAGAPDEVAAWLAGIFADAGPSASVLLAEMKAFGHELHLHRGFRLERGITHPNFTGPLNLPDPAICVADLPLTTESAGHLLGRSRWIGRPLLVVAEPPPAEVTEMLAAHSKGSATPVVPVGAPWAGPRRRDVLEDLAGVTGATVLVPELMHSFSRVPKEALGSAVLAVLERESTLIVDGAGDTTAVAARLDRVDRAIAATGVEHERSRLFERRGALDGRTWVISSGAATPAEQSDRKRRARSAIAACRAAASGGVVPGAGLGLRLAAREAARGGLAGTLLAEAAGDVVEVIARNAGLDPDGDLADSGLGAGAPADAFPIVEAALATAVSVTEVALSTEAVVVNAN